MKFYCPTHPKGGKTNHLRTFHWNSHTGTHRRRQPRGRKAPGACGRVEEEAPTSGSEPPPAPQLQQEAQRGCFSLECFRQLLPRSPPSSCSGEGARGKCAPAQEVPKKMLLQINPGTAQRGGSGSPSLSSHFCSAAGKGT